MSTAKAEDVATDVAGRVMSPFCEGVTLENCPSEEAVALRHKIATKAAAGWSEDRILRWLRADYGIREASPPTSGVGLAAWLAPAVAVLLGAVVITIVIRRKLPARRAPVERPRADPGELARLERDLAEARKRA